MDLTDKNKQYWTMRIRPHEKLWHIDLGEIWRYRDLIELFVRRNIVVQYKQTILGPLWYLIQPMLTTVMYMFVFGGLAGISTDGVPQPLFYMAGVCMWGYFQQCFTACSNVFAANQGVFGKVYFPRLIVPLSSITSNLIRFGIQFLMFVLIYIYFVATGKFEVSLSWSFLLFPVFVAMIGLHAMSWGLIITSLTTKYRDLNMLIGFGVQLLMYATPVIYPLSFAPKEYQMLLNINPLTPIFEAFKYSCLGSGTFDAWGMLYSTVTLVIVMFFAVILFNRTEQRFMDTV